MTTHTHGHSTRRIDDRDLDRLVDGELDQAEYRELLLNLDATPDGWKRCALAFLEAQALRRDLGEWAERPAAVAAAAEPIERSRWRAPSGAWALAAAACFLAAAVLNWRPWSPANQPAPRPEAPGAMLVGRDAASANGANDPTQPPRPAGYVPLLADDRDGGQRIELPYYDARVANWDSTQHIPDELRRLIDAYGDRVQVERTWAPVVLEDGAQVIYPVDRYQIKPVSY